MKSMDNFRNPVTRQDEPQPPQKLHTLFDAMQCKLPCLVPTCNTQVCILVRDTHDAKSNRIEDDVAIGMKVKREERRKKRNNIAGGECVITN